MEIKENFNLVQSREKEWYIGNGLGGFASSTIIGMNTRKYHGLLISSIDMKRIFCVSRFDEFIIIDGESFSFSTNQYPEIIAPKGYEFQKKFNYEFYPIMEYEIKGIKIKKSVFMIDGFNATVVRYEIKSNKKCLLEIVPLVNFRDFHQLTKYEIKLHQKVSKNKTIIYGDDKFKIVIGCSKANFDFLPCTYFNMEYLKEMERGYEYRENHFSPGVFKTEVKKGNNVIEFLIVGDMDGDKIYESLIKKDFGKILESYKNELEAGVFKKDPLVRQLTYASDLFITQDSIIAGYPWFGPYARDIFISFTGLLLVTKRYDIARNILKEFSKNCYKGLIPNTLNGKFAAYNSVDSSLWFIYAVHKYLKYTKDYEFIKKYIYGTMKEIIKNYIKGTDFKIRMDKKDGLISAGDKKTNLTWMDAKYNNKSFTPRCGKAVEVNALWYNSLMIVAKLGERFNDKNNYERLAELVRNNFEKKFWNGSYLDDVIGDKTFRPNQIFAVSLDYPLIGKEKARIMMKKIAQELVTPVGLRSISPYDKRYIGRYEGNQYERDSAYHNGTVWSWLLGPFITAYIKINNEKGKEIIKYEFLNAIKEHLTEGGIGQISEIFDGEIPFHPRGCPAQAWSVGEILRVLKEDL